MMRRMLAPIHDIWCAVTHRCRPRVEHDLYIQWLKEQEESAIQSAATIRQRRQHAMVATMRHQRGKQQ